MYSAAHTLRPAALLLFSTLLLQAQSPTISTVTGTGGGGFNGDGGPAVNATLVGPTAVAADAAGNLYISDTQNNRVRKVTTDGNIATVAGNGQATYTGDGKLAPARVFRLPKA